MPETKIKIGKNCTRFFGFSERTDQIVDWKDEKGLLFYKGIHIGTSTTIRGHP